MTDEPQSTEAELMALETGLLPYDGSDEPSCIKCGAGHMKVHYHPVVIMSMGDEKTPCAELLIQRLMSTAVTEHLCVRCLRCGYGWATETADAE